MVRCCLAEEFTEFLEILSRDGLEGREEAVVIGGCERGSEFLCCGEYEGVSGRYWHFDVVCQKPSQCLNDAFCTSGREP